MKKQPLLLKITSLLLLSWPFMEARSQCGTLTLDSYAPSTFCANTVVTISGTYNGGIPYTVTLLKSDDNSVLGSLANITTTSYNIVYTVPGLRGVLAKANLTGCEDFSDPDNPLLLSPKSIPSAYTVTTQGNFCSNGTGYPVGTVGSQASTYNYRLFRNGVLVSTLAGANGPALNFSNQLLPGVYTISGRGSNGCVSDMNGAMTITGTPAIPTYTYTWCGAGALTLTGISTTTGASFTLIDLTHPATFTGSPLIVVPPSSVPGNSWSLSASLAGCTSAVTNPGFLSTSLPTPVIQYLTYDNDCPGPCGIGSYTITLPGTAQINLHEDSGTPTTNFWNMTSNAGAAGTTYQWLISGAPLSGYTSQTFPTQPKINNAGGQFQVRQTNVCGSVTSNQVYVTFSPAGIGRKGLLEDDATSALIHPNPTSGELNINSPYDNYTLTVLNLLGSEVLTKQVNESSTKIDLSSLSAGSYVVRLVSTEGTVTKTVQVVK